MVHSCAGRNFGMMTWFWDSVGACVSHTFYRLTLLVIVRILCFAKSFLRKPLFSGLLTWRQLAEPLGFFKGRRAWCLQHRGQNNLVTRAEETYIKTQLIRPRRWADSTRRPRQRTRKQSVSSSSRVRVLLRLGFGSGPQVWPPAASLHPRARCSSRDGVALWRWCGPERIHAASALLHSSSLSLPPPSSHSIAARPPSWSLFLSFSQTTLESLAPVMTSRRKQYWSEITREEGTRLIQHMTTAF